jgi:hypothetical protein
MYLRIQLVGEWTCKVQQAVNPLAHSDSAWPKPYQVFDKRNKHTSTWQEPEQVRKLKRCCEAVEVVGESVAIVGSPGTTETCVE